MPPETVFVLPRPKDVTGRLICGLTCSGLSFRARPTEATYLANTCVSTPSLCNANFGPKLA